MVLRNISIKNYGPIDDLSYTFRFDETGKPIPLVLIGKNGCGKTLLFSAIIDMMVEAKRKLYPNGILEVVGTNYYKIGNHSYIKVGTNTSSVKIEYGTHLKCIKYVDVMSRNPAESISNREIEKFIKFLLMTSRIMHLQKTILFNILLTTTLVLISFLLMDSDPH